MLTVPPAQGDASHGAALGSLRGGGLHWGVGARVPKPRRYALAAYTPLCRGKEAETPPF